MNNSHNKVFHLTFFRYAPKFSRTQSLNNHPAFADMAKKSAFLGIFFWLTLFENTLKYPYVCQQANINRQQLAPFPVGSVKIGKISTIFQSKTLIPQNKNQIF